MRNTSSQQPSNSCFWFTTDRSPTNSLKSPPQLARLPFFSQFLFLFLCRLSRTPPKNKPPGKRGYFGSTLEFFRWSPVTFVFLFGGCFFFPRFYPGIWTSMHGGFFGVSGSSRTPIFHFYDGRKSGNLVGGFSPTRLKKYANRQIGSWIPKVRGEH